MDSEIKSDSEKTAQEKNSDQAKKTESEHISHSEENQLSGTSKQYKIYIKNNSSCFRSTLQI